MITPRRGHLGLVLILLPLALACGAEGPTGAGSGDPIVRILADPYTLRTGDTLSTVVTLEAEVDAPAGDPVTVVWSVPGGTFVGGTDRASLTAKVSFLGASSQTVTVAVSDGAGGTAAQSLTLELGTGLTRYEKNYVEALFLGSGDFAPRDGNIACPSWNERWSGFPRGTTVRVIMSTTVDGNTLDGGDTPQMIRDALVDVPYATAGWLNTTFETTTDADPLPGIDEVTSTDHPAAASTGCASDLGCIHHGWRDPGTFTILASGRAVQKESIQAADGFVHDVVGHGIMGLCHIDQLRIGGNAVSLMPGGPGAFNGAQADKLTASDIVATRAVFSSGLSPGDGRSDFLAADLINPR